MIRTEIELHDAREELERQEARIVEYRAELERSGLPTADIERALEPVRLFASQLRTTVQEYERLRKGQLPTPTVLGALGPALVASRIAAGVTQRELAARLDVNESLVSRDEKSEYQGVTIERASRIFEVLGFQVRCSITNSSIATGGG